MACPAAENADDGRGCTDPVSLTRAGQPNCRTHSDDHRRRTVTQAYPLRFEPLVRQYIWGGRRLETELGKSLGGGERYAESWEVVDHGEDQSVVRSGSWSGKTLHELVLEHCRELLGRHHRLRQFPLLLKFLDAQRTLSVQVHPNDRQAAQLDPPDLGKTEAWVVLATEPGSTIFAGLKPGVDRATLEALLEQGACDQALHSFEPQVGNCVFVRAGTVHALGAGLVVAEIQQASDTTFRLFDWNRVDADGKPRPLHIEQALATIDYDLGPVSPHTPRPTKRPEVVQLVACDKFVLDRWQLQEPLACGGDNRFRLLAVIEGIVELAGDPVAAPLKRGGTVLVPAACGEVLVTPREPAVLLEIYLP